METDDGLDTRYEAVTRRLMAMGGIAAIGVILSVLFFVAARTLHQQAVDKEFAARATERMIAIDRTVEEYVDVLHAFGGFFDASDFVDREDFETFASTLLVRHAGIQALEWIPRVRNLQRADYEQAAREDGLNTFVFTELNADSEMVPASRRDEYHPVYYASPIDGNERALGFDLSSNPARRQALRARKTISYRI